jgi:ABC-type branched-subunit amino acid transport system substrate-binding protein
MKNIENYNTLIRKSICFTKVKMIRRRGEAFGTVIFKTPAHFNTYMRSMQAFFIENYLKKLFIISEYSYKP